MTEWFKPAGSTARDGFDVAVTPGDKNWEHSGLYVATLRPGQSIEFATGDCEYLVLPLSGSAEVVVDGETIPLGGRVDVDLARIEKHLNYRLPSVPSSPRESASILSTFRVDVRTLL